MSKKQTQLDLELILFHLSVPEMKVFKNKQTLALQVIVGPVFDTNI